MVTDSHKLLGQALGTCTLQRLIGRGGMGAVYLAQQSRPRRTVAVKVLMPGTFSEQRPHAEFLARFRREADAIAALDHINIMPIYEYGEQEDLAYLVMPYVTGGTLGQRLDKRGKLPFEEIIRIIDQAASGLDFAHEQGIIHRDLKPGNILFHADGRVLLADFGLAKMLHDMEDSAENEHVTVTTTGTIIGTPEYLAPEQSTGKQVDSRTDIYSLGVVLYRMLTGRVPFTGVSPVAVAIKHMMEDPPPLSSIDPTIPHSVEAVVMKAIAKKPEERFASAGDFAQALHNAVSNTEQTVAISSPEMERQESSAPITLPTNTDWPQADDQGFHSQLTEETPPVAPKTIAQKLAPPPAQGKPVVTDQEGGQRKAIPRADVADNETVVEVQRTQEKREPVKLAAQIAVAEISKPTIRPRSGCQSIGMMMLGSILTLLVVIGGFTWYLKPWIAHQINVAATPPHVQGAATPGGKPGQAPGPLPGPAVGAGPLLYGTILPGDSCDKQGGKWANTAGAVVTCDSSAVTITNTGSGRVEGTLFSAPPAGKTLPQDYIVQMQVNLSSGTHGEFGLFFRTQPGTLSQGYVFLINPAAGRWSVQATDGSTVVYPQKLVGKIENTITIDVFVSGNSPYFLINGQRQGGTEALGITDGTFGLAVSPGSAMSVQNVAIYALP